MSGTTNEAGSPAPGRVVAHAAPPIPQPQRTSVDNLEPFDFGDDEEAMLEYALTLSRQLSQPSNPPPQTPTQEPIRTSDIDITESGNNDRTLSPSAMRLLDLIEEALNIPSPTVDSDSSSSESDRSFGSISSNDI